MTKKSLSDENFYRRIVFAGDIFNSGRIFFTDENILPTNIFNQFFKRFFRVNLNALVQNFGFLYYLREKNPTENEIIAQFISALLCFQPWFLWKPECYSIHYGKNIRRQKVFVGKKWRNYWQVTKFFTDEIFHRRNFYR